MHCPQDDTKHQHKSRLSSAYNGLHHQRYIDNISEQLPRVSWQATAGHQLEDHPCRPSHNS